MGAMLSHPVTSKGLTRDGNRVLRCGSSHMQGFRTDMEDAHTVKLGLVTNRSRDIERSSEQENMVSLFGVFDGHGGKHASEYVSEHLWRRVAELEDPQDEQQLTALCKTLDRSYKEAMSGDVASSDGTTVVFAVVAPVGPASEEDGLPTSWRIKVANLGDSRAVLLRADGTFEPLSEDHKPQSPVESARIVAAGGHTSMNRVDGELALSRAIGDFRYKLNPQVGEDEQKVIAVPDFMTGEARVGDSLLIFCDGIVEQLENEDVAAFVHERISGANQAELDEASVMSELLMRSLEAGSKDNHSAMLVRFGRFGPDERYSPEGTTEFVPCAWRPHCEKADFVDAFRTDAERHGVSEPELTELSKRDEPANFVWDPSRLDRPGNAGGAGSGIRILRGGGGGDDDDGDGMGGGDDDEDMGGGQNISLMRLMQMAQAAGMEFAEEGGQVVLRQSGAGGAQIEEEKDDAAASGGGGGPSK